MLLERTYKRFVRGGALLDSSGKEQLRKMNSELASLGVRFGDNLLKEMNEYRLVMEPKADLAGLPEPLIAGAAEAARKAGLAGKWVFTLHAPSLWPFLQYAENRELRRQMFTAYTTRGDHGNATDNTGGRGAHGRVARAESPAARLRDLGRLCAGGKHGRNSGAGLRPAEPALARGQERRRAMKPRVSSRPSKPKARISSCSPGIGSITPRRCARRNTRSMKRRCVLTSNWKTCATARSGLPTSFTASPSPR